MLDDDGKEVPGTKGYKYGVTRFILDRFLNTSPDISAEQKIYLEFVNSFKAGRRKRKKKTKRLRITKNF
jgi:hypothetical protein